MDDTLVALGILLAAVAAYQEERQSHDVNRVMRKFTIIVAVALIVSTLWG